MLLVLALEFAVLARGVDVVAREMIFGFLVATFFAVMNSGYRVMGLWGKSVVSRDRDSSDLTDFGGATAENTGDGGIETFTEALVFEQVMVGLGEVGDGFEWGGEKVCHGLNIQTFVRISNA
jgi:hypothetical protein